MHFDLPELIKTVGIFGVGGIVFAESGLLIGFFLPGDSLLFTAGFLASQGFLDIWVLAGVTFVAAVAGDSVGYSFGKRVGRRLFHRQDSIFFHKKHLEKAERFYEKNGKKTIVIARFMSVVRTFAPIVAGIGDMKYRDFLMFNIIGGFLWSIGLTFSGYFLGQAIPDVDKYLLPIVIGIIIASVLPQTIHMLRDKEIRDDIVAFARKFFKK